MDFVSYSIEGSDFKAAGAASRAIKEHLKRIGADAEAIRRTMIAAYEAEMNVVIHAERGRLQASLSDRAVDVNVIDEGPGIPDIRQAMKEGFSTATSEARALGFGAGMGLPNIQRNSDRLRISSHVGQGTRVSFTVMLKPAATSRRAAHLALRLGRALHRLPSLPERLPHRGHARARRAAQRAGTSLHRLHLLHRRLRVRTRSPSKTTWTPWSSVERPADAVLALPPALLAGFGEHAGVPRVLDELRPARLRLARRCASPTKRPCAPPCSHTPAAPERRAR